MSSPPQESVKPPLPPAPAPAPDLLPSCLQTWIKLTKCKDNSDTDCFCKDSDFTKHVQECIGAWAGEKKDKLQGALSYLAGICAAHIPVNPGIVTNCPSGIVLAPPSPAKSVSSAPPIQPQQPASSQPGSPNPPAPTPAAGTQASPHVTTISISQVVTVTVTCTAGQMAVSGATGCTTTSLISTHVGVPNVQFATTSSVVNLVQAAPVTQPAAAATPAAPVQPAQPPQSVAPVAPVAPGAPAGTTLNAIPSGTAAVTPAAPTGSPIEQYKPGNAATALRASYAVMACAMVFGGLFVVA